MSRVAFRPNNSASICATSASGGRGATLVKVFRTLIGNMARFIGAKRRPSHDRRLSILNWDGWLFPVRIPEIERPASVITYPTAASTSGQDKEKTMVKPIKLNS